MSSRRCDLCAGDRYPNVPSATNCPVCNAATAFDARDPNVSKPEWDQLMWVKGRQLPKALSSEEIGRCERDWQALEEECARRGPRWSPADLLEEGFLSKVPSG